MNFKIWPLHGKSSSATVPPVRHLRKKISMKEQMEAAIEEMGGEPLDGSGFERETPEEGFSGGVLGL
jgi:hypothetical protein